jgi:hypothetical protein
VLVGADVDGGVERAQENTEPAELGVDAIGADVAAIDDALPAMSEPLNATVWNPKSA